MFKKLLDKFSYLGITHIDSLCKTLIDGKKRQVKISNLMNIEDIMLQMYLINGLFQPIKLYLDFLEMKWITIDSSQS